MNNLSFLSEFIFLLGIATYCIAIILIFLDFTSFLIPYAILISTTLVLISLYISIQRAKQIRSETKIRYPQ